MRPALGSLVLLLGCQSEPACDVAATRCRGAAVEVCESTGEWQPALDCRQIAEQSGGAWRCEQVDAGDASLHTCVPTDGGE